MVRSATVRWTVILSLVIGLLAVGTAGAEAHVICGDDLELTTTGYGQLVEYAEHRQATLERLELTTRGYGRIQNYARGCYG